MIRSRTSWVDPAPWPHSRTSGAPREASAAPPTARARRRRGRAACDVGLFLGSCCCCCFLRRLGLAPLLEELSPARRGRRGLRGHGARGSGAFCTRWRHRPRRGRRRRDLRAARRPQLLMAVAAGPARRRHAVEHGQRPSTAPLVSSPSSLRAAISASWAWRFMASISAWSLAGSTAARGLSAPSSIIATQVLVAWHGPLHALGPTADWPMRQVDVLELCAWRLREAFLFGEDDAGARPGLPSR